VAIFGWRPPWHAPERDDAAEEEEAAASSAAVSPWQARPSSSSAAAATTAAAAAAAVEDAAGRAAEGAAEGTATGGATSAAEQTAVALEASLAQRQREIAQSLTRTSTQGGGAWARSPSLGAGGGSPASVLVYPSPTTAGRGGSAGGLGTPVACTPLMPRLSSTSDAAGGVGTGGLGTSPDRPPWKPDGDAPSCEAPSCGVHFTLLNRRHHCRACGGVFCDECSSSRVRLPAHFGYGQHKQRVCDLCGAEACRARAHPGMAPDSSSRMSSSFQDMMASHIEP